MASGNERNQVADYFVVVGIGDSVRRYNAEKDLADNCVDGASASRLDSSASTETSHELRQLELPATLEPITDVGVVFLGVGEKIPDDFSCISSTPTGHCANFHHGTPNSNKAVYLCYRRGRDRTPLTDIDIVYKGAAQYLYDRVERSVTGRQNADINHSPAGPPTHICFRRASSHSGQHFYGMAVTDICVVNPSKGEQVPRGFTKIDRPIRAGLTGPTFYLAYKKSLVKPHAVSYQAGILARFPPTDFADFPLPESVPLFCLPLGASVESWSDETDHPLPTFSSFVLTGTSGDKVYGAAVSFYEDISEHESISKMKSALFGATQTHSDKIYCSKSICIMSHFPYFDAFKAFLSSLYRISISGETPVPLERYISNFMTDVPFPSPKRPKVLLQLGNESIYLSQPVRTPLPLSGAKHSILLHALSAENLVTLLCLVLLEHKIILHSVKPSLLTIFGEALCSILFPFSWECPYIPLCPLSLASFIHAPIPFIIGIDSRFFDLYDTPDDVCCINLDNNTIAHSSTSKQLPVSLLPKKQAANLLRALKALQVQIPLGIDLDSDLAVTVAPLRVNPDQEDTAMSGVAVREAFLRFNAQICTGYSAFLRPLVQAPSEASTDVSQRFDLKGFMRSRPPQEHAFFTKLFDTQLFNKFVEERSFVSANDSALVFFDECTEVADNPEPLISMNHNSDSLMTVVVSPPNIANLPRKTFAYPSFSLDPSLFLVREEVKPTPEVPKSVSIAVSCRRSRQEKSKSKRAAHRYIGEPRKWPKFLLAQTYALWYTYLPAYVHLHTFKREAVTAAFKLLERMHSSEITAPDEVLYRILIEVCGVYGYPALAVRVLMEMRRMNLSPNAVTYARYNKVALESQWPSHTGHWRLLRNVLEAVSQLRVRLKERRAIEASSAALASADKRRISVIRKALSAKRSGSNLDVSSQASCTSIGEDDDTNSFGSVSSMKSSYDINSLADSRDDLPTVVYQNVGFSSSPAVPWSTEHLNLGASAKIASPIKGHRRGASCTIKSNGGDIAGSLSAMSAVTSTQTASPSPLLPRKMSAANSSSNVCRVALTTALKDLDLNSLAAVVTMASCTPCHHCNCLLFDEQIMTGWQADDSDFNTRCPYCSKQLIAFLSVTAELNSLFLYDTSQSIPSEDELSQKFATVQQAVDSSGDSDVSSPVPVYLCGLKQLSIPYLSPLLLRKEVETLLEQDPSMLSLPALVDQHAIIYWNLAWYFHRLDLPSHLSSIFLESEIPKQHNIRMGDVAFCTSWHKEDLDETPPALYKQWINRGTPTPSPVHTVNDALASQLQSLTARLQCGEYSACVDALLTERVAWRRAQSSASTAVAGPTEFRGLYWDLLLLLVTVSPGNVDLAKFDREFTRCLQKLPRDLSVELRRDDHALALNSLYFRRAFKALGMRHWS